MPESEQKTREVPVEIEAGPETVSANLLLPRVSFDIAKAAVLPPNLSEVEKNSLYAKEEYAMLVDASTRYMNMLRQAEQCPDSSIKSELIQEIRDGAPAHFLAIRTKYTKLRALSESLDIKIERANNRAAASLADFVEHQNSLQSVTSGYLNKLDAVVSGGSLSRQKSETARADAEHASRLVGARYRLMQLAKNPQIDASIAEVDRIEAWSRTANIDYSGADEMYAKVQAGALVWEGRLRTADAVMRRMVKYVPKGTEVYNVAFAAGQVAGGEDLRSVGKNTARRYIEDKASIAGTVAIEAFDNQAELRFLYEHSSQIRQGVEALLPLLREYDLAVPQESADDIAAYAVRSMIEQRYPSAVLAARMAEALYTGEDPRATFLQNRRLAERSVKKNFGSAAHDVAKTGFDLADRGVVKTHREKFDAFEKSAKEKLATLSTIEPQTQQYILAFIRQKYAEKTASK